MTTVSDFNEKLSTAAAVRTLLAAGFTITNSQRQPKHIEIECFRHDAMGGEIPYTIVFCEDEEPPQDDLTNIKRIASNAGRVLVIVAKSTGDEWISWEDFCAALGGAVPSWRALGSDFDIIIDQASKNSLPTGMSGEAWQIFEEAVADGLEFIFGRRVRRLGGKRRGQRVSDMVALTPDYKVIVVDAKASINAYDVTWDNLRALVEYTKEQEKRQRGQLPLSGTILAAADFKQADDRLVELSNDFLSEAKVPLTFMTAGDIANMVQRLSKLPYLRNALNWSRLLCRSGRFHLNLFEADIIAAEDMRYSK